MPAYDYHCSTNGQTVEVNHTMTAMLSNWKELCDVGGLDLGDTPADAPVKRRLQRADDGVGSPGVRGRVHGQPGRGPRRLRARRRLRLLLSRSRYTLQG